MIQEIKLLITIRHTDEPTLHLLEKQLRKQISLEDRIFVISNNCSLESKMRDSFGICSRNPNFDALLMIDADCIVCSSFIKRIKIDFIKTKNDNIGYGYKLLDRFYDDLRYSTCHVYRLEYLYTFVSNIPREGLQLRPETYLKMKSEIATGLKWQKIPIFIGCHDFFQSEQAIYSKFYLRAHKNPNDVPFYLRSFSRLSRKNNDYSIALNGVNDAIEMRKDKVTSSRQRYINNKSKVELPWIVAVFPSYFVQFQYFLHKLRKLESKIAN